MSAWFAENIEPAILEAVKTACHQIGDKIEVGKLANARKP
jgi:hypothetical protein